MTKPLINILIRTSNRPVQFARCLKSIFTQNYPNIRIIVSCDNVCSYVPPQLERIQVSPNHNEPYFYDSYCNNLKAQVNDGWFFFLDDDDILAPGILNKLELTSNAILVQLQRAQTIVPNGLEYRRGLIGMPCLILHHSLKDIADIPGTGQGDYYWIKAVHDKVGLDFQPLILVHSFSRGLGMPEHSQTLANARVL